MNIEQTIMDINESIARQDTRIGELEVEVRNLKHDLNNARAAVSMMQQIMKERKDDKAKSVLHDLSGDRTQTST